MKKASVKFWGVRGSMASPGSQTSKIGGNTSCVTIEWGGTIIICDGGTGIHSLSRYLMRHQSKKGPINSKILLSHLHLDHFIGLPFFKPFYFKKNRFELIGPSVHGFNFGRSIFKILAPPYFPFEIKKVGMGLSASSVSAGKLSIGPINIVPMEMNHPGGALGWRFDFPNGASVVHVTDNEPDEEKTPKLIKWMDGADVLIHDAQFSRRKYEASRKGWGHSPFDYPLELAHRAGVRSVYLFHFDPDDTDEHLARVLIEAKRWLKRRNSSVKCHLACEGLSFLI